MVEGGFIVIYDSSSNHASQAKKRAKKRTEDRNRMGRNKGTRENIFEESGLICLAGRNGCVIRLVGLDGRRRFDGDSLGLGDGIGFADCNLRSRRVGLRCC